MAGRFSRISTEEARRLGIIQAPGIDKAATIGSLGTRPAAETPSAKALLEAISAAGRRRRGSRKVDVGHLGLEFGRWTQPLEFELLGRPRPKKSSRSSGRGLHTHYIPDDSDRYMNAVKQAAGLAARGRPCHDSGVIVHIDAYFAPPASWSPEKVARALDGKVAVLVCDYDNIIKAVMDGCSRAKIWRDDMWAQGGHEMKHYGLVEKLVVRIEPLNQEAP